MKFYGNGIVWNKASGRRLCKFNEGVFYTDDISVINALDKLGYKHDGVIKIEAEIIEQVNPEIKPEIKPVVKKPTMKKAVSKK
jgi:hypothetical protein